ncbi:hypothetical protein [Glycomyces xiaoerkulensis]|uniref:hypothetical protein n=1 Tax=Glycomyces xiaoerkulensis TaxID=2038139 RepID=UPI0012FFFC1B|nr:hypothetical protein [Glycomyces xiaoerkulensis]
MERTGPLNDRQLETLQLIGSGDDLSSDEHTGLRITARALASRGLVTISKRTGQWRAAITDAGRHYLEHGRHPDARSTPAAGSRRKVQRPRATSADGVSAKTPTPRHTPAGISRDRHADAAALVERLVAEHTVRLPSMSESEYGRWRKTIDYAKRNGLVPEGHFIESIGSAETSTTIRLVAGVHPNAARKHAQGLEPVPVPDRLRRPHPVVARLRDDSDRLMMPKELRRRSLLIFQALAGAALERGWKVSDRPVTDRHQYGSYGSRKYRRRDGAIEIRIDGFTYAVTVDQEFPQSVHPVKSQSLKLELPHSGSSGQSKWADRKTMTLEERLPEVVAGLAKRAVDDRKSAIAAEKAKVERQRRWESAMARAKEEALEHHYGTVLDQQAQALERFRVLSVFCDQLEAKIRSAAPDTTGLESSKQWLRWARAYTASIDPLQVLPAMPSAPDFKLEDLKPFLGNWSPYGPESHYGRR